MTLDMHYTQEHKDHEHVVECGTSWTPYNTWLAISQQGVLLVKQALIYKSVSAY